MTQKDKLLLKLTNRASDRTWSFGDLDRLLRLLGYRPDRVRGSHHIYLHTETGEDFVLPRHGASVKPAYVQELRKRFIHEEKAD